MLFIKILIVKSLLQNYVCKHLKIGKLEARTLLLALFNCDNALTWYYMINDDYDTTRI